MKRQEGPLLQRRDPARSRALQRIRRVASVPALAISLGCAPTVNVLGVYFPAWLISAVVGVVAAYAVVWFLGRRPAERALGQSGLFFCSLTVIVGLLVWWIFFSGF